MIINTVKLPTRHGWVLIKRFGSNYAPININNLFSFVLLGVSAAVYSDKKEIKYERVLSSESELSDLGDKRDMYDLRETFIRTDFENY